MTKRVFYVWVEGLELERDASVYMAKSAQSAACEHAASRWLDDDKCVGTSVYATRDTENVLRRYELEVTALRQIRRDGREGWQLRTATKPLDAEEARP